jgi:non-ribosomal peptide synthase protein (TIGR01720 family)
VLYPERLLLTAHHLVIDGVSWRILLEDLETAYKQSESGEPIRLPAKSTPFRVWSTHLHREAAHARYSPDWADAVYPLDQEAPACPAGECKAHPIQLSRGLSTDILERCHEAYGTEVNDILLAALARALQRHTKRSTVAVLLESHGRESLPPHPPLDLTRTIGWFTAIYPVRLDLGDTTDPGRHIKLIKETLRAIPNKGIGYGVRRYLTHTPPAAPEPRVVFNYLGQFGGPAGPSLFTKAPEDTGPMADPNATFPHDLEINGAAFDGRLEFTFSYNPQRFPQTAIPTLANAFTEELERLTSHALGREATELTPSDIDYTGFNMDEMELFLNNLPAEESR